MVFAARMPWDRDGYTWHVYDMHGDFLYVRAKTQEECYRHIRMVFPDAIIKTT